MGKRALAFDFGASSGRAILATLENGKIEMQEIHRFSNDPVMLSGVLHWDLPRLFFEIKQGITKAVHAGGFDAIGIDTWGVDFGLLNKHGELQPQPLCENIITDVDKFTGEAPQFDDITMLCLKYSGPQKGDSNERTDD